MVLSDSLRALFTSVNVPAGFSDWIEKSDIVTVDDFARIATNEDRLETKIIEGNHKLVLTMIDEVRIRSAWAQARAVLDAPGSAIAPLSSAAPLEHVLAPGVEERLAATWLDKHRINLMGSELLSVKFIAQIYTGLQKARKSIPYFALDQLRLKSDLIVPGLSGLVIDGSSLTHVSTTLALDTTCNSIFSKISAYMTTIAYVSADCPSFLEWETCRRFLQIIYTYACLRMDCREPTVKAVAKAWMLTFSAFLTQVQNHQKTLNDLISDDGTWNHHWRDMELVSANARASSSATLLAGEAAAAGAPRNVVDQMASHAKLVRSLQSSVDSLRSQRTPLAAADAAASPEPEAIPEQREESARPVRFNKRRRGSGKKAA